MPHGGGTVVYDVSEFIIEGSLQEYSGPTPTFGHSAIKYPSRLSIIKVKSSRSGKKLTGILPCQNSMTMHATKVQ